MAVATRDTTIETFLIHGGVPLSGTVRPAGNKNAALPILAACVLTADPVTLDNVPRIRDVEAMIDLLRRHRRRGRVALGPNRLRVWAADIRTRLDAELCFADPSVDPLRRTASGLVWRGRHPPPGGDVTSAAAASTPI
jgi:UDP-N-acetylglucosamine 1-carboxyvinyltransferase